MEQTTDLRTQKNNDASIYGTKHSFRIKRHSLVNTRGIIYGLKAIKLKGGEASSHLQWFTIAKMNIIFENFCSHFGLQRYLTNTKRYPP